MSYISCISARDIVGSACNINMLQGKRMIHTKDHKTGYLIDPWSHLGPKRRRLMEQSWAGLFREHILCELPVHKLAPFFTEGFGRPTKELYTVLGVLIIQQMRDLTDEETVTHLAFNEQWHYALDIPDEADDSKYMSPRTLWSMRRIVTDNELDTLLFEHTSGTLGRVFKVDTSTQRIDSVHIRSNMRRLGRIRIFAETINKFLTNLKRWHRVCFESVAQEVRDRYLSKEQLACFSMVKPSASAKTLTTVSADLFDLVQSFKDTPKIVAMHSYTLMTRVLEEQCTVTEASATTPAVVSPKPPREIPSDSLQNPSDPDAAYDGHKGQGYQVQVMETYCDAADKDVGAQTLNLITHVEVEPACASDANALIPALQSTKDRHCAPTEVLADSLYGSDDNVRNAHEMGTEVIAPAMGAPKERAVMLSDFTFAPSGKVLACPRGYAPMMTKHKKNRHTAGFDVGHCSTCALVEECPVKAGKKYYYLHYDDKAQRIARRRAEEQTPDFKDRYRYRAGAEATMSEYDRRTGVKQLRVRGLANVRFCAKLKAIGVNIFRATAVRKAIQTTKSPLGGAVQHLYQQFYVLKERYYIWHRHVTELFAPHRCVSM